MIPISKEFIIPKHIKAKKTHKTMFVFVLNNLQTGSACSYFLKASRNAEPRYDGPCRVTFKRRKGGELIWLKDKTHKHRTHALLERRYYMCVRGMIKGEHVNTLRGSRCSNTPTGTRTPGVTEENHSRGNLFGQNLSTTWRQKRLCPT